MKETIRIRTRVLTKKGQEDRTFWRAGIEHHSQWQEFEVTPEQLEAIEAEPMLEVEEVQEKVHTLELLLMMRN